MHLLKYLLWQKFPVGLGEGNSLLREGIQIRVAMGSDSVGQGIKYKVGSVKTHMSISRNPAQVLPADSPAASSTAPSVPALCRPPGDPRGDGD